MTEVTLVKADWCPICPQAQQLWKELGKDHNFEYTEVDISSEKGKKLVERYSIMSVPTTLIDDIVVFIGVPNRERAMEIVG